MSKNMQAETSNSYRKKIFYVKHVIFLSLFAIVFLQLISSLPGLYRSIVTYQQAQSVYFLNDVSDDLFTAVGNYGFERGRVNVVLNDAGPVEKMEGNRQFILACRNDGNKALNRALESLKTLDSINIKTNISEISDYGQRIDGLRKQSDKYLVLPKDQREKGLSEFWFSELTEYIERIEALLVIISKDISDADGMISRYSSLKLETLALRNTAGPEMSILSATMLSGTPIKPEQAKKIESLQIITKHHFQKLSFLSQGLSSPLIPASLENLKKSYFTDYLPYREEIFPLAYIGGPYPYSQEEFLGHGVKALKETYNFMDSIVSDTREYATMRLNNSRSQIIVNSLSSSGSLIMVILIILYVHLRVIKPISQLTSTVHSLTKKDLKVDVPLLDEQNEIGEMARAIELFKEIANQHELDMYSLRSAEEKIRKKEEKLRYILDNIPDIIFEVDAELNVLWANKVALDINPNAVGQACYKAFHSNDTICEGCYCFKALETGRIEMGIMHHPASKAAETSYWENIGVPLKSSDGNVSTILEVSRDITDRMNAEAEREKLISELRTALTKVKTLSGLLPICSYCKKIRDDKGYWNQIEAYIRDRSEAEFSHSICQECANKYHPDLDIYADGIR
jgi:HAMP domain-containing protein